MIDIIKQIPDWNTKTAQQIHDELSSTVILEDPTPHTFVSIGERLGSEARSIINDTMFRISNGSLSLPQGYELLRADIDSARSNMSVTTGLSLHFSERQALIDVLAVAGGWPVELTSALKALGRPSMTKWAVLGGQGAIPAVIDIQTSIDVHAFEQRKVNAVALFNERMTSNGDAGAVMSQAWIDAGV